MIELQPVLPVVVIDDAGRAADLARTLLEAGIRQAEVTLRTPDAVAAIAAMASVPGMRVGAGTVLSDTDVDASFDAGATFVVSPGTIPDALERAGELGLEAIPGVATASEIARVRALGIRTMKLFPAEPLGGPAAVSAFAAVFPDVSFVPTGGIDAGRAAAYLAVPAVAAVGGSWMVPRSAVATGDFARIGELCRTARALW